MQRAKSRRAKPTKQREVFPIVGIGASAGGLDAFKRFFSAIPADSGAAFVLIQHLDPTRESLTADLVGASTRMRVVQAEDGMPVEADRVYVIPPNTYLSLRERTLHLSAPTEARSSRMAIDFFLRSLAEDQHERTIGIVLSGTGTDGTLGLQEIKAIGGITMAQDPATAQHDGMPRSAIASGSADHVLPVEELADTLLAYVRHGQLARADGESLAEPPPGPLASVVALLQSSTKFDFSGYKIGTLRRRIERRMSLKQLDRIPAYVDLLRKDPTELAALHKDLLINVTSFFRDPAAWQILQERVIRRLVAEKDTDAPLRVWVPACATGEEAYSIAMVLIEEMQAGGKSGRLQVFASDVDAEGLEVARTGVFPHGIAAHMSAERLNRFFTITEHGYCVNKELRDVVVFAPQNLLSDPPFSKLDLISCRNLLIYLEPALQDRVTALLHFALLPGGHLFLGSAEGIGSQGDWFEVISKKWRIYRRTGPARHDKVRFPVATPPGAALVSGRMSSLPPAGRLAMLAQQLLLERYAPASVIINRSCEIFYFHGRIDDYLMHPTGLPTRDLLAKVRSELRSTLRGAIRKAMPGDQRVVVSGVRMRRGSTSPPLRITVEPLAATREIEGLWLVSFESEPEAPVSEAAVIHTSSNSMGSDAAMVQQLEHELKATKEDLQLNIEDLRATNEELLSVNEELQSSNEELEISKEELMSVNEELQSSNEELETSKEELQSLNEELTTANTELESKVIELEATNTDLDNLLTSTNIATVFLDTHRRIRRFTPAATRLFSLIPADIGRPINDIAQKFVDPALLSDIATVLQQPITPKTEVQSQDGQWYVRQVLPYRTHDNRTEGVVITFSDVAAEALEKARLYAESIVDTVREPLLVLDADMRVRSANRSFYSTFRVSPEETVGRLLYHLGNHQWDIPRLRMLLGDILPEKHMLNDFEIAHEFTSIGLRTMLLNARAIRSGDRPDLILLAIEDITEHKHARQALQESEALKRSEEQVRQREAELAHALRISTIGEMASNLAHELNQPLSSIANSVEACAHYVRSGKVKSSKLLALLDEASSEALRAGSIVEHLRSFIQQREPRFEPADLREIARGIPRLLGREIQRERITFQLDSGRHPLPIHADRIQIEQIIVNLMQNAIDAIRAAPDDDREIRLRTRAVNGMAELSVGDNGAGLPEDATERLFEPFFTTKPHGLGMGLAISRSIIEAHQGRIWVQCPSDGATGTTLCLTLPLQSPSGLTKGTPHDA